MRGNSDALLRKGQCLLYGRVLLISRTHESLTEPSSCNWDDAGGFVSCTALHSVMVIVSLVVCGYRRHFYYIDAWSAFHLSPSRCADQ